MMKAKRWLAAALILAMPAAFAAEPASPDPVSWRAWSPEVFAEAQRENKPVLLDLEAVWCHWCHVMSSTTYRDPAVVTAINRSFIPVRANHEAFPDLAVRYEPWGWPATVIFSPRGEEWVKRRGYIPPQEMARLLQNVAENPGPQNSVAAAASPPAETQGDLSAEQRGRLERLHEELHDEKFGGWGRPLKLLQPDPVEWAFLRGFSGDAIQAKRVRRALDLALKLEDRQWGGFFQYSDELNWKSPHYEKIMWTQTHCIRFYVWGFLLFDDGRYLEAARRAADYAMRFWSDAGGGFYSSQDADVARDFPGKKFYRMKGSAREKLGRAPKIDRRVYTKENGWMISNLALLYDATGEKKYLDRAIRAAEAIRAFRGNADGSFRRQERDAAGPYLGDNAAIGAAFLDLYVSTGDRSWLEPSLKTVRWIARHLADPAEGGYFSSQKTSAGVGVFARPAKSVEENLALARWALRLRRYSGDGQAAQAADRAARWLIGRMPQEGGRGFLGLLSLDFERRNDPVHVTVVGPKSDPRAAALFAAARRLPAPHRQIEWYDPAEGALPNPATEYPALEEPAAFFCENRACSAPVFSADQLFEKNKSPKKM